MDSLAQVVQAAQAVTVVSVEVISPQSLPLWLTVVLGATLPILYQKVLSKLTGWLKFTIVYVISGAIAAFVGMVIYEIPFAELFKNITLLWAIAAAVYNLMVKRNSALRELVRKLRNGSRGNGNNGNNSNDNATRHLSPGC